MRGFFYPESVAVIGVSPRPGNLGRNIVTNLKIYGFGGPVFCVSPRGGQFEGQPIYTSMDQLPQTPDLAVILTPAPTVPGLLEACGQLGVKRVIIESGGFSELGGERAGLEAQIKRLAKQYGIRFIGPNCIGVICTQSGVAVPFPILGRKAPTGGLSIVAQSGGIGLTYLHRFSQEAIGISKFASVGNKVNVGERDLLAYLLDDPDTTAILLYLESIVDGRAMCDLIRQSDKPVVVHKSNIAELSHGIAHSHTAALANDDLVVEEALKQAGAIRAHTVNDCINIVKGLTMPRPKGRRVVVVSRSGGHAVVAADAAHRLGLDLPRLPDSYLEPIQKHFRASVIKLQNPLDLGDLFHFELYVEILRGALSQDNVDAVMIVLGYRGPEAKPSREFLKQAGELCRKYGKPVALVILAEPEELALVSGLSGLPLFQAPEEALLALTRSASLADRRPREDRLGCADYIPVDVAERLERILNATGDDGVLELPEALHLISAAGMPVAPFVVAGDPREAAGAAAAMGFPVALKAVGVSLSHKTDQGGVILNLASEDAVEKAAARMFKMLPIKRLVVMSMISGGQEVIVGAKQDPAFGPLVLFGLGGVTAEVLKDVSLRLAPVDDVEAGAMLDGLRGADLLKGYRGLPAANRAAVLQVIMQVASLAARQPRILELDLNPVLVGPGGAVAVDARVRVRPQTSH